MSINEIIKKYLPLTKQKPLYANNNYNYCLAYSYQNCRFSKRIKCTKKINYQSIKKINSRRWHIFFLCPDNHLVIRWVIISDKFILAGQIKN